MTINIPEYLEGFYKEEAIHTTLVEYLEDTKIRAHFIFKPYTRTVEPMDHVGMSQMNEALLESLYCCIGNAIKKNTIESPIDFETFLANRYNAIFMREHIKFRKMLKVGEEAILELSIKNVQRKFRGKYHAVTCGIQGFMRGEAECWLATEHTEQYKV